MYKNIHYLFTYLTIVLFLVLSTLFVHAPIFAYPSIQSLDEKDIVFLQLQQLIHKQTDSLYLFEYITKKGETLASISRKLEINIESLVSLNRLPASLSVIYPNTQHTLIIPNKSGIFLAKQVQYDIEYMLHSQYKNGRENANLIVVKSTFHNFNHYFYFLENAVWTKDIQTRWEQNTFRFPVIDGTLSSRFGSRKSPISGNTMFHNGIDISSKEGTWIFSTKNGIIKQKGFSKIFGYFIQIEHQDESNALYGHILDSNHTMGDTVLIGEHIATMGSTGLSTGAHTHFELTIREKPINPLYYLE